MSDYDDLDPDFAERFFEYRAKRLEIMAPWYGRALVAFAAGSGASLVLIAMDAVLR